MKPLMLIPPAQAEALYDAQEEAPTGDRFAPLPWLDDDVSEDDPRGKSPATVRSERVAQSASVGRWKAQHWPSSPNSSR